MCVLMDTKLNGFSDTLTEVPPFNPVLVTSAERSEMLLFPRRNLIRFVNPDNAESSEILLFLRYSTLSWVSPPNDVMFETVLPERSSPIRFLNPDNAGSSEMLLSLRARLYQVR